MVMMITMMMMIVPPARAIDLVVVVVVVVVVTVMVVMIARHLHPIVLPVRGLIAGLAGRRRVGCPQRSHRVRNRVKQFGK